MFVNTKHPYKTGRNLFLTAEGRGMFSTHPETVHQNVVSDPSHQLIQVQAAQVQWWPGLRWALGP